MQATNQKVSQTEIFFGADHGGFELKEQIKNWLQTEFAQKDTLTVTDLGAHSFDAQDDYPEFALAVAEAVAQKSQVLNDEFPAHQPAYGILFCRSGGGMSIAANKVKGIRAVPVYTTKEAQHAREHNDATVISISGDWNSLDEIKAIVTTFLTTPYSQEERHTRRLKTILAYEQN